MDSPYQYLSKKTYFEWNIWFHSVSPLAEQYPATISNGKLVVAILNFSIVMILGGEYYQKVIPHTKFGKKITLSIFKMYQYTGIIE